MRIVIIFCILLISAPALASVSFVGGKWESSFDLPEWRQGQGQPPGDFGSYGTWTCNPGGLGGQITTAAKNPLSTGERGFRHWQGDGENNNSGGIILRFPKQKELWLRWYHRYEKGFRWVHDGPRDDKLMFLSTDLADTIASFGHNSFGFHVQNGVSGVWRAEPESTRKNWRWLMNGYESDGEFHHFEIHIKMDTNRQNGIGRFWINGQLVVDRTDLDFSGGYASTREGWKSLLIGSNQKFPDNGRPMYVDYDDIVIYTVTPPNTDAHGNPFIGPIGWGNDNTLPIEVLPTPENLRVQSLEE